MYKVLIFVFWHYYPFTNTGKRNVWNKKKKKNNTKRNAIAQHSVILISRSPKSSNDSVNIITDSKIVNRSLNSFGRRLIKTGFSILTAWQYQLTCAITKSSSSLSFLICRCDLWSRRKEKKTYLDIQCRYIACLQT